ncbi:hypothetical protein [Faecalimicrobium sp. JNUCC 81]
MYYFACYGFSRYSTDKMWIVPHFEKMLYDNPNTIVVVKDEDYKIEWILYLSGYGLKDNNRTYYICRNNSCTQSFNDIKY